MEIKDKLLEIESYVDLSISMLSSLKIDDTVFNINKGLTINDLNSIKKIIKNLENTSDPEEIVA